MISAFLFSARNRPPAPPAEANPPEAPDRPVAERVRPVRPERAALKLVEIAASLAAIAGLVLIASARADWIAFPEAGATLRLAFATVTLKGAL